MNNLFGELKRRNVFRVAGVYAVAGWVIAQIANTLKETLGLPEWFDATIVALLLLGFPVAIIFAWAFELTPDGVVRTEDVPEDRSITADTGRKLDVAIVVALFALIAMVVWQQIDSGRTEAVAIDTGEQVVVPATDASIAVLPFDDLSPEGDQQYFSDGIAEEILNVLVGVEGLDVTSRTSSFQFRNVDLGIPQIAAALNVRHVVEGSVRKSGSTIRVTAQLIDSSNDKHLWSDTYDRPLTTENIFQIQDEIANAIVNALSDTLGVGRIEPVNVEIATRNLDAYELYLRANALFHDRIDLDVAEQLLAQAVELDPQYALAWEVRSAVQVLSREYGYVDATVEEAQQRATEFAERALELDPKASTAMAVLANIQGLNTRSLRARHRITDVKAEYDRALEIQPRDASALNWRGLLLMHAGFLRAALADFEKCTDYEPYYRPCVENTYTVLGNMGRDDASNAEFLAAMNTGSAKLEFAYLPSLARTGEELAFKMATNGPFLLSGWRRHEELWQAYLDPTGDHQQLAESILAHLAARSEGHVELGSYIAHPIGSGWPVPDVLVMWDPMMHVYRQSREFKAFIRESGVYDYWLEVGFPPQCRPLGDDNFECD